MYPVFKTLVKTVSRVILACTTYDPSQLGIEASSATRSSRETNKNNLRIPIDPSGTKSR